MWEKMLALWTRQSDNLAVLGKNLAVAVLIIIVGMVVSRAFRRLLTRAEENSANIDHAVMALLKMVVRYGVIIVCAIMILNVFGVNTASLIAVLGAAGVAIGLALKDTLSNIAAGIILLFLRVFRAGDFVEFDSGDMVITGTVKEINLFTTILETADGVFVSAPNSSIWEGPLKNYTRNGKRRMDIAIGIAYSDSIDTAFRVMQEYAAAESRFLKTPAPQVTVQSLGDNSVNIMLRAWCQVDSYWSAYWDATRALKERFDAAGLHIPFPQRDVHIIHN